MNDGIIDVVIKDKDNNNIVTEVTINNWTKGNNGNETFVGTTTCTPNKVYNEEYEVNIAKARASIKELRRCINIWEGNRPSKVEEEEYYGK